jgi:hypothetical protein
MNLINSKPNIKQFDINSNIILFVDGKLNSIDVNEKVDSFVVFDKETLIIYNSKEKKAQLNFPNIPVNFGYKKFSASKSHFLLYDRESLDLNTFTHTKEAIYSIPNKKIIYQGAIIGNVILNNYVVDGIGKKYISIFSVNKKTTMSSFTLYSLGSWLDGEIEKPYQVSEFCDIYNKILISTLNNGDILLLDIEKGEPIKLFKETKIIGGLFQKEENSPIYIGLKFKTYIEINIEKAEIIKKIDLEQYFKQKFNRSTLVPINTTIYQNELIYFIADTNIVGVFDPNKTEVIDYYEFNFENKQTMLKGGKENLQVKDNNIYCLDNQNTLYTLSFTPPS